MITGFNHTSFTVRNLDRALEFWSGTLGFHPGTVGTRQGDWQQGVTGVPGAQLKVAHIFGHGAHIELIEYQAGVAPEARFQPSTPCAGHICLEVDDIDVEWARLIAAGASPQGAITTASNGPGAGMRAAYMRDPDGIIVELLEIKDKPGA